ncbi:hypothetical protein Trydic_g8839 [Trypoxylus dichotomus]
MEEQLEIAENRCNTLKDQLDHMKKLYQHKTENNKCVKPDPKVALVTAIKTPKRNAVEVINTPKGSFVKSSPSLDNSGAAVQTINNILNGITNSVNRLSQIHIHMERPSSKRNRLRDSACGDDTLPRKFITFPYTPKTEEVQKVVLPVLKEGSVTTEDVIQQSSTVISVKSKVNHKKRLKRRNRSNNSANTNNNKGSLHNSTITINITNKKSLKSTAKHVEKRFKIEPVKMISRDSSSILSPKKSKKQFQRIRRKSGASVDRHRIISKAEPTETEKLVEIYHNNAAKGSETEDSTHDLRKTRSKEDKQQKSSSETVPSLPLDEMSNACVPKQEEHPQTVPQITEQTDCTHNNFRLAHIKEHPYTEPTALRTECYSMCSKNYELPTIASKMKQVAKSYLRRFNFHSIPFCAAKSTSPSHNIGINIQQVMNIIKTRQPITGISPTLAHNITLAAEKLQGSPFTAVMSSLGSHVGSLCPLLKQNINYQQLQEMAKEIPEEVCEEGNKKIAEEEMAAGDRNLHNCEPDGTFTNVQLPIWTSDPGSQRNCTCVPQQGIGFQQVLSRYNTQTYSTSTVSQLQYRAKSTNNEKFFTAPVKIRTKTFSITKQQQKQQENGKITETKLSGTLKGKEKNLKEVLTNLHDEFSYLNQQYDLLSKKLEELGSSASEETVKQLEQMERCLNNKEEEINMVMTLYKEVVALKRQVKQLKERASMASLTLNAQQQYPQHYQTMQPYRNYNDTHTAVHLTKLLRQIQMYQEMNRIGHRN